MQTCTFLNRLGGGYLQLVIWPHPVAVLFGRIEGLKHISTTQHHLYSKARAETAAGCMIH